MDRTGADAVIRQSLARVLDWPGDLARADTPLAALGLDSLGRLCLVDACREAGVTLDDAAVSRAITVADLLGCVLEPVEPQ